ncbi:hypothetical protein DH2020_047532 [Rehmannia glutinosa]|uniref:Nuclease associated modular domain-containing protein n=1 Tax=Rehmannia glutinosa TaxID=99300 RepID=A0ABR0U8I7_REHGL
MGFLHLIWGTILPRGWWGAWNFRKRQQSEFVSEQCALDFRLNELPMPLLDIASSQPCSCFGNNKLAFRSETHFRDKFLVGNDRGLGLASTFSWKTLCVKEKVGKHLTLERAKPQSSSEDSTELGEREKLRRMRISKANKGNTPWNKGRKHSAETLQRIKERTRLAMQDPKVKMKLVNLGHAQSEETRMKIGAGVRLGWERRREKLMLQETCHYEWQNLIMIKGSKRAPKSAEQKRKISEAISAKWADPEYRNRVCSGLAKFHGIPEGIERKPRRKPSGDGETRKEVLKRRMIMMILQSETKSQTQQIRSRRRRTPSYKDPLASSKLLIAEAEKAAEALEIAAKINPLAQASLMESRMLIAEANQIIESIEREEDNTISFENDDHLSENSSEPVRPNLEKERDSDRQNPEIVKQKKINGANTIPAGAIKTDDFSFNKFVLPDLVNGNASRIVETDEKLHQTSSNGFLSLESVNNSSFTVNHADLKPNPNGSSVEGPESQSENLAAPIKETNVTKKWVRGKLVEVAEEI